MALRLCHSSLRPRGGVTAAICWSHHWLWHHYCSPAVLTGLIGRLRSLYEQDGQLVDRTNAVTDFLTIVPCRCPLCVIQHLLNRQQQKSSLNILHPFKACLKTHKGPQSHIYAHLFELHMFPFSLPDRCLHQILFHWGNECSFLMSTEVIIITEKLLKKTNECNGRLNYIHRKYVPLFSPILKVL